MDPTPDRCNTCLRGHQYDPRKKGYNGGCDTCAKDHAAVWNAANKDKRQRTARVTDRERRHRDKQATFAAYGGVCACCGEERFEFLTLDHINNDGAAHRREVHGEGYRNRPPAGHRTYRWLRTRGFPPGFQVLCMNCNFAKGVYGACPHKKEKPRE